MRRHLLFFVAAGLSLAFHYPSAQAASATTPISPSARAALEFQIENLLREIEHLKALLDARSARYAIPEQYVSRFFSVPIEASYVIDDGFLVRLDRGPVRRTDEELFSLLRDTLGKEATGEYVSELRVFYEPSLDMGAFVELREDNGKWIFGVDRSGFRPLDIHSRRSFANLFLHEYAHVLLWSRPELVKEYESRFWTNADSAHAERLTQAHESDRPTLMRRYFDRRRDRFVSDYATVNVDEDMAETFAAFVVLDAPAGNTVRDEKIRFFHADGRFANERQKLRTRLLAHDLLPAAR